MLDYCRLFRFITCFRRYCQTAAVIYCRHAATLRCFRRHIIIADAMLMPSAMLPLHYITLT